MKESTTSDTTSKSIPTQESAAAAPLTQGATGGTRSKLQRIFGGRKRQLRHALIVLGAVLLLFVIIPKIFHAWLTVSTDDAYVNSYVTFVAPRVIGQVAHVFVDYNN